MKRNRFQLPFAILFASALAIVVSSLYGFNVVPVTAVCLAVPLLPKTIGVLGMNNTNNISARDSFRKAKDMFFQAWRKNFTSDKATMDYVEGLKLSQSEIRLEVELATTLAQFTFGMTPNQANSTNVIFNTENRLQLQDSLVVSEYGIFVGQPASRIDTAWRMHTYGNTQDFAAADAAALDTTFYNHGFFSVKCNNDVIIPYRGLFNHWYKPQTQQTAALGAGSPGDQIRGAEDGMITQEPNLLLVGSKNYQPQIVLPVALASAAAFERCVLIFRGVLAQNSTVVN